DRGAEVTLICGATSLATPFGIKTVSARTNEEMLKEVLDRFDEQDIVIKAAAVADYKPKQYSDKKIKKAEEELNLTFTKDNDILKKLGSLKKNQILVGFAAESNDLLENAQKKLNNKNLDCIVANDITASDTGFASDNNKVTIICRDGKTINLDKMSKRQVASRLFDLINV
ncbi:bifunctional 4'-phosphopantothenoylcysteine decarboxylase/phosphopantothenoylcysteine synthetase, partial [Clostridiaceae bacterium UIB06]|nr:bifunctional 4'-phosphopantothenoylcysteine decarboxylase/phosphopantothenoylcysteine synthetase [Clostridiaceae bacterium UIB06]